MNSLFKPPLTFFLPLLLLVSRAKLSPSQRLPGNTPGDSGRHPELFYENGLLPDGREMTAYAAQGTTKKFFFTVDEDNTPVRIVVTPCSARIEWNLSMLELPEDGSGSSAADQLSEQRPRRQPTTTPGTILKSYSGYDAGKYMTNTSPACTYVLEVRSVERGTSFQIYATSTPDSDHFFPELPSDPQVDVTSFNKNRVSLAWKPSPSDVVYHQPVRYCLAINTRRNYHTWCGVQASVPGGGSNPFPSSQTRFGFDSEREMRRARKRIQEEQAILSRSDEAPDMVIECVGSKTLHTITNLDPGTRYFFDLFAVDQVTNRSVAFIGTSIYTRAEPPDRRIIRLKDGGLRTIRAERSSSIKQFRFPVSGKSRDQDVNVTIQSCSQTIAVEIWREGVKIRDAPVKSLKHFSIRNVEDELLIKVKTRRRTPTDYKIFATTNPSKYPFPQLPKDSTIRVFKNLRQCTSVTLAWLSTKEVSQYCLYMREEDPKSRGLIRQDSRCHGPKNRKKSEKVLCRSVNGAEAERDALTEVVTGLKAGTKYIFDVYVSGVGKETLAYKSKTVKTKRTCDV
ncbi:protein NDNF-like [Lytechinus pictus]|uniref:protein NDNF-like n=1 Tax=Lytechinus pictus TaxID=7653 RepID=UPI0030BA1F4C